MILRNQHKHDLNKKSKKTFYRLFWGFSALTSALVPVVLSSGCYNPVIDQVFYVNAPDGISQDLGIKSTKDIPTKANEFNQKSTDEKINYLFGNDSELVSSYIKRFDAIVDGERRINFTLGLAPKFVFSNSQTNTKVFSWTFGTLPTSVKVRPRGLPLKPKLNATSSASQEQRIAELEAYQQKMADYCVKFNAINSVAQQIALVFGNNSEFNATNTKSVIASLVAKDKQDFHLEFKVNLNPGFAFINQTLPKAKDQRQPTVVNNYAALTKKDDSTYVFKWSPNEFLSIEPTDYNHFLVMKDLQPVSFANWFNTFGNKFKSEYLLNNPNFKLTNTKAVADGKHCRIFFKLTENKNTDQNLTQKTSEELSSWVISEKEYNELANSVSFYNQKEFDLSKTNPFQNVSLQTIDFSQIVRALALKFPPELAFAFFIKSFSFEREHQATNNQVDLCCKIGLCQHHFISAKPSSLISNEFSIKLRNFVSIDVANGLQIIKQYSYTATDGVVLSDQLAKALIYPLDEHGNFKTTKAVSEEEIRSITFKKILNKVSEPLSQVLCRDSQIISQVNWLLSNSDKLRGFNLTQLEPLIQQALMGLLQNKSVNDIVTAIANQTSGDLSAPSKKEMVNSLIANPSVVNHIFSTFSEKIPVASSTVRTPLLLLTSPSTFATNTPTELNQSDQWWKYGLNAQGVLGVLLPQLMAMNGLDIINGIIAVYLAEEISGLKQDVANPVKLRNDPKLKQVSEALIDINKWLYLTDPSFPKQSVYITDKTAQPADLTDSDKKNYIGFNLAQCAYRNLLSPETFIRCFNEVCLKRISTAQKIDANTISVPASGRYQLETFGFVIDQTIADDQKLSFTLDSSDSTNPTLKMTLNGRVTFLPLNYLKTSSSNYWADSPKYKDGLFNVSLYGLLGDYEEVTKLYDDEGDEYQPKTPVRLCLVRDVLKILNYNFAGPGGSPLISDLWCNRVNGTLTYEKTQERFSPPKKYTYVPGWINQSGISCENIYNVFWTIIEPIERSRDYTFAKSLVPPSYCLTYDCLTHEYVFKETYSTPQPKEITFDLEPLKALLGKIVFTFDYILSSRPIPISVPLAKQLLSSFKYPYKVIFENTITFNNLDFLNSSSRLITAPQELVFDEMSSAIDYVLGLNVSGTNPKKNAAIYHIQKVTVEIEIPFFKKKLPIDITPIARIFAEDAIIKPFFVESRPNPADPTGKSTIEAYKKRRHSITIQFIN